jgi:hypothetical protein
MFALLLLLQLATARSALWDFFHPSMRRGPQFQYPGFNVYDKIGLGDVNGSVAALGDFNSDKLYVDVLCATLFRS